MVLNEPLEVSKPELLSKVSYPLSLIFWVLILIPLPPAFKAAAIIPLLFIVDIEFLCLITLIAGYFKAWGPVADVNSIVDLTLLALGILAIRIMLLLFSKEKSKPDNLNQILFCITGFFVFVMLVSLMYSIDAANGWNKLVRFVLITLPTMLTPFLIYYFLKKDDFAHKIAFYLTLHGTFFSLLAIINNSSIVFGSDYIGLGRLSGTAGLISFLYIVRNMEKRKLSKILPGISLIVINIWALFLSGSRGPTISFILVLFLSGLLFTKNPRIFMGYLLAVGMIAIISYVLIQQNPSLLTFYNRTADVVEGNYQLSRIELFQTAWEMFLKSPVMGFGLGSFGLYYKGMAVDFYPHNLLLELMAELGLLGIIVFMMYFTLISYKTKKLLSSVRANNRTNIYGLILIFIYILINSFVSGDINSNKFLWFGIGLLLSTSTKENILNEK